MLIDETTPREVWVKYEAEKREIRKLGLSPEKYTEMVVKVARRLGIK